MAKKEAQKVSERPVAPKNIKVEDALAKDTVKMRFKENKFYNDLDVPLYIAGEVYVIKGADMIQRWLKRGGEIVEGDLEFPETEANPSDVVPVGEQTPEVAKTEQA